MRWSVTVVAEGDRVVTREEVVELADAVAALGGIASGIGTESYGAQIVVHAENADEAVEHATRELGDAAARAGLPPWPVTRAEVIGEDDAGDEDG
jgi:hypothetical protein